MSNCIYCGSSLIERYCPVCEPKHFEKLKEQFIQGESSKGSPRRPGAWIDYPTNTR